MDRQSLHRTEFDVGGIIRRWGPDYSSTHAMYEQQRTVMRMLGMCRTASLGGFLEKCDACGHERPVYASCGNRHCPLCQGRLMRKWIADRMEELLPVQYFHCIFTVPGAFDILVPRNERTFYGLVFSAASWTLKRLAKKYFGGDPGIIAVLHTWGQTMWRHPHLHCIVTGGALSFDRRRWVHSQPGFLFDVFEMSELFRGRFCKLLRKARLTFEGKTTHLADGAAFERFVTEQQSRDWVVYCKDPVAGPERVVEYIGRYTHRVAISNRRILDVTDEGTVTFEWKDYRDTTAGGAAKKKEMQLCAQEFIGRFMMHVLPRGFRRIRMYGILAGANRREKLEACRAILGPAEFPADDPGTTLYDAGANAICPECGTGTMHPVACIACERGPPVVLSPFDRENRYAA